MKRKEDKNIGHTTKFSSTEGKQYSVEYLGKQ